MDANVTPRDGIEQDLPDNPDMEGLDPARSARTDLEPIGPIPGPILGTR